MKEQILKLREEGKTYNEIKVILGCSKSTISYYCGNGQKDKVSNRTKKRRENILLTKVDSFKQRTYNKKLSDIKGVKNRKDVVEAIRKFQKRDNSIGKNTSRVNKGISKTFTWEDVLERFGEDTICYLSGERINLYERNYQLDHIIPSSKSGDNSFNNLGISHEVVNKIKGNLSVEELLEWCVKILNHNNYNVNKNI